MSCLSKTLIFITLLLFSQASLAAEFFDYSKLNHRIEIDQLRSGKYSADDLHQLRMIVEAQAYLVSDPSLSLATKELGVLGTYELVALSFLSEEATEAFLVEGEHIRQLVSQQMFEQESNETDINVRIAIKVNLISKKYYLLEEARELGEIVYNIVDHTTEEVLRIPKRKFNFKDTKGGYLQISLHQNES